MIGYTRRLIHPPVRNVPRAPEPVAFTPTGNEKHDLYLVAAGYVSIEAWAKDAGLPDDADLGAELDKAIADTSAAAEEFENRS